MTQATHTPGPLVDSLAERNETMPDNRPFTFGHDWAGGATLTETATGLSVYFQPGDGVAQVDDQFERLVGHCGYSGAAALAIIWSDYSDIARQA